MNTDAHAVKSALSRHAVLMMIRQRQCAGTVALAWKRYMVQPLSISKAQGFTAQTRGADNGKDLGNP